MEKNSWVDKIANEEMLTKVEEDRQITKFIQQTLLDWAYFEAF